MKWTTKARIQKGIAALPGPLAAFCYYRMQRHFGGLRNPTPSNQLAAGARLAEAIRAQRPLQGARVMEVGTGRSLAIPVLLWLSGAERVLTVDLNPWLRPEILRSDLAWLRSNRVWLEELLVPFSSGDAPPAARLESLFALDLERPAQRVLDDVLQLCCIDHAAPADARDPGVPERSLDIHLSRAVLEHVPPDALGGILRAAARLLKPEGLCVHLIDLSDHFQHQDASISRANFLRFSDEAWDRLAGNRFMYMNRLRASEYLSLFAASGLELLDVSSRVDGESLTLLESGALPLAARFRGMSTEDLATDELLVAARPAQDQA